MVALSSGRRVLVTGASGEIGRPLLRALVAAGHELVVLSRRAAAAADLGHWVQGDLQRPETLAGLADGCSVVVHMAAVTHTRRPREYHAVNVDGTAALLESLRGSRVEHFVHLSSRAVGTAGGAYAASKAAAEEVVAGRSGVPWTILRPAEVYGSGGGDPILQLARDLQRRSWVPVLGDGSYRLAPVHAEDVVAAVVAAVRQPGAGARYLLAGPESFTYLELIAALEQILRLPRRRRVAVPLWAARTLIRGMAVLGVGGYVPDQVPRLLLAKDEDSVAARRDLAFAPRTLAEGVPTALVDSR